MANAAPGPTIFVLSRPRFEDSHRAFLERANLDWKVSPDATDAERLIEFAGRLCYLSFGSDQHTMGTRKYIAKLIAQGHESVLEHAVWSFLITGVSRAFSHQLVRHRVGFSFSQLSQQYHDSSGFTLALPADIDDVPGARAAIERAADAAREAYRTLSTAAADARHLPSASRRERTRAYRSLARSVLPNATETKLVVTANARALRHFIRLRGTIEGDLEMRIVASSLIDALRPDAPSVFAEFEVAAHEADSFPIVRLARAGSEEGA